MEKRGKEKKREIIWVLAVEITHNWTREDSLLVKEYFLLNSFWSEPFQSFRPRSLLIYFSLKNRTEEEGKETETALLGVVEAKRLTQ